MILSPWPMILRSLPITDLAPTSDAEARRCGGGCCGALRLGPVLFLSGSSFLGSTVALRVNIGLPRWSFVKGLMAAPPHGRIVSGLGPCGLGLCQPMAGENIDWCPSPGLHKLRAAPQPAETCCIDLIGSEGGNHAPRKGNRGCLRDVGGPRRTRARPGKTGLRQPGRAGRGAHR